MTRRAFTTIAALLVAAGIATPQGAAAHDFFLLPSETAASGPDILIKATIGSHFPKPEITVPADRVDALLVRGAGTPAIVVAGGDADGLALRVSGAKAGTLVASASIKPRDIDYAEDRIPLILGEYRIAPATHQTIDAMAKPRTLRVVSRRLAKTIVCVQRCDGFNVAMAPVDGRFEFVAADQAGSRFRLLLNGQPLADYPVDMVLPDGKRTQLQSDAKGEVAGPARGSGRNMMFAAHMTTPGADGRYALDLSSLTVETR